MPASARRHLLHRHDRQARRRDGPHQRGRPAARATWCATARRAAERAKALDGHIDAIRERDQGRRARRHHARRVQELRRPAAHAARQDRQALRGLRRQGGRGAAAARGRARGRAPAARLRPDVPAAPAGHYHRQRARPAPSAAGPRSTCVNAGGRGRPWQLCRGSSIVPARRSTSRGPRPRAPEPPRGGSGRGEEAAVRRLAGVLVTLEGVDGCGKTTQVGASCASALPPAGLPVGVRGRARAPLREPGGTPAGEAIRDVLLHGSAACAPGPRRCCTRRRGPSSWRRSCGPRSAGRIARARPLRRLVAGLPGLRPRSGHRRRAWPSTSRPPGRSCPTSRWC